MLNFIPMQITMMAVLLPKGSGASHINVKKSTVLMNKSPE